MHDAPRQVQEPEVPLAGGRGEGARNRAGGRRFGLGPSAGSGTRVGVEGEEINKTWLRCRGNEPPARPAQTTACSAPPAAFHWLAAAKATTSGLVPHPLIRPIHPIPPPVARPSDGRRFDGSTTTVDDGWGPAPPALCGPRQPFFVYASARPRPSTLRLRASPACLPASLPACPLELHRSLVPLLSVVQMRHRPKQQRAAALASAARLRGSPQRRAGSASCPNRPSNQLPTSFQPAASLYAGDTDSFAPDAAPDASARARRPLRDGAREKGRDGIFLLWAVRD